MKFSSVPAYSFGSKTAAEPVTTNLNAPGPGTYNLRGNGPGTMVYDRKAKKMVLRKPSFPQATRPDLFQHSDFPGPNEYFQEKLSKSKSQKSVKASHPKEKSDKNKIVPPGPSTYDPQKLSTVISYSMGNKVYGISEGNEKKSLGPGSYNPDFESVKTSRATKFGTTAREFNYDTNTPGPGAYEVYKAGAVSTRFGSSERNKAKDEGVPGPGNYQISRDLGGTLKSLTARRPIPTSKDFTPGPGAYEIKHVYSAPAFALGHGNRTNFIKPGDNPGPGAYETVPAKITKETTIARTIEKNIGKTKDDLIKRTTEKIAGISIGKGKRPDLVNNTNTPGPGAYSGSSKSIGDGVKTSLNGRRVDNKFNDFPGPGQYNPSIDYARSNIPAVGIGNGQRVSQHKSQRNRIPGPGEYENINLNKSPAWTFKRDPRSRTVDDDEPGPGYYDIPPVIPDVPKYLLLHNSQIEKIE